jgi:hypothetical protein
MVFYMEHKSLKKGILFYVWLLNNIDLKHPDSNKIKKISNFHYKNSIEIHQFTILYIECIYDIKKNIEIAVIKSH